VAYTRVKIIFSKFLQETRSRSRLLESLGFSFAVGFFAGNAPWRPFVRSISRKLGPQGHLVDISGLYEMVVMEFPSSLYYQPLFPDGTGFVRELHRNVARIYDQVTGFGGIPMLFLCFHQPRDFSDLNKRKAADEAVRKTFLKLQPFVAGKLSVLHGLSCFGRAFAHYKMDVDAKTVDYDDDTTGILKWKYNLMSQEGHDELANMMKELVRVETAMYDEYKRTRKRKCVDDEDDE
jgi:hypothetical protein